MTDRTDPAGIARLLQGSLAVWRLDGDVEAFTSNPPTVRICRGGRRIYVTRRSDGAMPPCWEIRRTDGSSGPSEPADLPARSYAAVPGMLRAVRAALDPDARSGRLIIGTRQA